MEDSFPEMRGNALRIVYYGKGMEMANIFIAIKTAGSLKIGFRGKTEIVVFHYGYVDKRMIREYGNIDPNSKPVPCHIYPVNMAGADFFALRNWAHKRDPNHQILAHNAMTPFLMAHGNTWPPEFSKLTQLLIQIFP